MRTRGATSGLATMAASSDEVKRLLDFDSVDDTALFQPVDDAVMGGMSSSRLAPSGPGIAAFEGNVSLENGGGFASVRSGPRDWDTAGAAVFVLRVRGDGKRYRFNLRTPGRPTAFRYEAPLEPPAGGWVEVEIPMAGFEAKVYGRAIPGVGPPDTTRIESLGFMISDKQAGPFRLEIDWIAVKYGA
jgi:NADH dehydrogenase [ubiquinone] 1 alpha subcomplex assembly factor 1